MFSLAEASMQLSRLVPLQLLVLGWGEHDFMAQLLLALGTGASCCCRCCCCIASTHSLLQQACCVQLLRFLSATSASKGLA
jgi:hypothetical protein